MILKKRINRKQINLLLSFLMPACFLTLVYIHFGMYPFGEKSVLIMDMSSENVDYFAGLSNIIRGGGSVLYSWSKAMGGGYLGIVAFDLASPFTLLTLLFPVKHLPFALMLLMILKPALSGATFCYYYQKVFKRDDLRAVFFSVCYALMAYNVVYAMSIMWLDWVYLLPLVLVGLEKIMEGKSPLYLICTLAYGFLNNYYLSFMAGIFCVVYLAMRMFAGEKKYSLKQVGSVWGKFFFTGIIAAGLAAVLLIPTVYSLMDGKMSDGTAELTGGTTFLFADFVRKFMTGSYDTIKYGGTPNIYCGTFILLLDIWFFVCGKISIRKKIIMAAVCGFFYCSMYFQALNQIWHVFRDTNWFPYRYSFLISFVLIFIACEAAEKLPAFMQVKSMSKYIMAGMLIITCGELTWGANQVVGRLDEEFGYENYSSYRDFITELEPLLTSAKDNEDSFYRLEKTFGRSKNDSLTLDYAGLSHYSSDYNGRINDLLRNLGIAQDYFWSGYPGSTPVTDSILGIKYIISHEDSLHDYVNLKQSYDNYLHYNENALELGFAAPKTVLDVSVKGRHYLDNENALFEGLTGIADVFTLEDIRKTGIEGIEEINKEDCYTDYEKTQGAEGIITYEVIPDTDGELYLDFPIEDRSYEYQISLFVNDVFLQPLYTSETKGMVHLGMVNKGELLNIALHVYDVGVIIGEPEAGILNREKYIQGISNLQSGNWSQKSVHEGNVLADVTVKEGEILMTTIPFEKGWHVYANGKKVKTQMVAGALLSVVLEPGIYEIQMKYIPEGMYLGGIVSLISVIVLVGVIYWRKRKGKKQDE